MSTELQDLGSRGSLVPAGGRALAPAGFGAPLSLPKPPAPAAPPRPPTRFATWFGLLSLIIFVGGFGAWSVFAPLSEAAAGPGVIKAEGNRRTIQHLEGGIVREIMVRDGDRVKSGDVIMRLDDVAAGAQLQALDAQRLFLLAQDARLSAELANAPTVSWPAAILARQNDPRVADAISGQTALFIARRTAFESNQQVLSARIDQLRASTESARSQLASQERQMALIREEMRGVAELLRLGLERRPRLLALQRAEASLVGNRDDIVGQIQRNEASIAENEAQMRAQDDMRRSEYSKEQREVRDRLAEVEERWNQARDVASRRDIVSPVDGSVLNLRFFTIGGVVRPGDPVLDIVPSNDRLIAEVQISPTDIDVVHPGLLAEVRLPAFKQRLVPFLHGKVTFVSADAVFDERTRTTHYRANVAIDDDQLSRLQGVALQPGMPVEVMVLIGERTFWQYLTQPLRDSFARAFREQ
ncbi:HlyD family type I secretion periplasmic adaptor subunit [Elioraea sp.]|uniref:HlyD family type I secretion periplasmic adaptor subunit n=1 Tax=Elioraea sp. TaxID=2185103 RepID=UPI0025BC5CA7|nr:HlyD family type I secretion periplasmic adaptor subunit [Elioraea sp.]